MLCVFHDLNLALHYFDKLLVLSDGEVAAFGPPDEVLRPEILDAVYGVRAYLHRHAGRTYLTSRRGCAASAAAACTWSAAAAPAPA